MWNQSFTFPDLKLNRYELENLELIFEAYDQNRIFANELIGSHSIGLSTMYRHGNHEFYRVWLRLYKPDSPTQITGYLQVSCFIVGPNERPPVHAQDEDVNDYNNQGAQEGGVDQEGANP